MSRLFDDGDSEYLSIDSVLGLSVLPICFSSWIYIDGQTGTNQAVMELVDKSEDDVRFLLYMNNTGTVYALTQNAGGASQAATTDTLTLNNWHHVLAVWAATNDRRVYLNGGNKGTNVEERTVANLDRFSIAAHSGATPALFLTGRVAEAAVWGGASLTDADALVLSKGCSPLFVKRDNLVSYWPLIR